MTERAVPGDPLWAELAAPHLARYLFAVDFGRGLRVLDAASGSGYGARLLRSGGAAAVVGVDLDVAAVAEAQSRFGGDGVEFLIDDCETLERLSGPFDLICNFETIEHLERPERFLAAAARLLAPGGTLLTSTPDRAVSPPPVAGRPRNRFHVHEWFREEFRQLLSPHFAEIEIRGRFAARRWRAAKPPWRRCAGPAVEQPADDFSLAEIFAARWAAAAVEAIGRIGRRLAGRLSHRALGNRAPVGHALFPHGDLPGAEVTVGTKH